MSLVLLLLVFTATAIYASILILSDQKIRQITAEKSWLIGLTVVLSIIMVILCLVLIGELYRNGANILPWYAYMYYSRSQGLVDALIAFFASVSFLLWIFIIPGHLKASEIERSKGIRPWEPYVANFFVGLVIIKFAGRL